MLGFHIQQVLSRQVWPKPDTKNKGKIILSLQWIKTKKKEENTGAKPQVLAHYSEVARKAYSPVVLSVLRQPAALCEIQ